MEEFILRPARLGEVDAIMQVMHAAMQNIANGDWFMPDDRAYMADHIDSAHGFCLVAEEKQTGELAAYFTVKLAGTAPDALGRLLGMGEAELGRCAQMDSCCVLPKYQGNRLEGRLLMAAEEKLRGMPYTHYLATVHPDNAASLYTALHRGYRIAAANVKLYGGKIRCILQKDKL